jgi:membrane associated rhomboid family serine protease
MIEGRDYMRGESDSGMPRFHAPASVVLMVVLVAVFAMQCLNDVYFKSLIEVWLALTPAALARGFVWQLLTFQFFHGSLLHLIGNLIGLWYFGRFVEHVLGRQRFLVAYFAAGGVGGLLQCVLMLLFPRHFGEYVFGASAGVLGMFAVFARLQATSVLNWNFILPIRADVLLWITAGISLFFTLVPSSRGGNAAHAAHLGGILAGLAWVKLGWHHDYVTLPWENLLERLRSWRQVKGPPRTPDLVRTAAPRGPGWKAAAGRDEPETASRDFVSAEVDPILDKISAQGIQSLTESERKVLEAARKKMDRR